MQCSYKVESWFDDEQMNGDITHAMTDGIDEGCDLVIICITRAFINKCKQQENSNCKLELNYAYERKGALKLLPIVMEEDCLDTRTWDGPVGAYLNRRFYIRCTTDAEMLQNVHMLINEIYKLSGKASPNERVDRSQNMQQTIVQHWESLTLI